jgi:hypothetical protein
MPPSPSIGHPGLSYLATVDDTPMKYTHNRDDGATEKIPSIDWIFCILEAFIIYLEDFRGGGTQAHHHGVLPTLAQKMSLSSTRRWPRCSMSAARCVTIVN